MSQAPRDVENNPAADNLAGLGSAGTPGEVAELPLTAVLPSPFQPRQRPLTKKDVVELMAAIHAAGQLTPIIVSAAAEKGKYVVHSVQSNRFLSGAYNRVAPVRFHFDRISMGPLAMEDAPWDRSATIQASPIFSPTGSAISKSFSSLRPPQIFDFSAGLHRRGYTLCNLLTICSFVKTIYQWLLW